MHGAVEIGEAMTAVIAPGGLILTDQSAVDGNLKAMLGEMNIDPDAAFLVGNGIMQGAVQQDQPPEETVVSAFVIGLAVGAYLRGKP
jgi:hypothetical protein